MMLLCGAHFAPFFVSRRKTPDALGQEGARNIQYAAQFLLIVLNLLATKNLVVFKVPERTLSIHRAPHITRNMFIRNLYTIGVFVSICAPGVSYAAVASVDYVTQHVTQLHHDIATKEDISNRVSELSPSSTDAQYPTALATYSAVSRRVDTDATANQNMAGTYTVSGVMYVPDQELPQWEN